MLHRLSVVVIAAILAYAAPSAGAPVPGSTSSPKRTKHPAGFSNKIRNPGGTSSRVSAADCNRRGVDAGPAGGQLGPNGASSSQTLIAVPIGGGNAAAATRQAQIAEACAHRRR